MKWLTCVLFASLAAGRHAGSEQNRLATISGHVVHGATEEPLQKVHVILEASGAGHDSALVATTDEAGHFRFVDVEPGVYELTAEKSGFLDGSYGADEPEGQRSLLRITAGDRPQDLTLRLFPGGTISGRVLDSDGEAVPGDTVTLWTRSHLRGYKQGPSQAGETTTNGDGEYRFEGLAPGTYYVSADAGTWGYAVRRIPVDSSGKVTKMHDLRTFYPAALLLADAQGIKIESGQEQSDIDIRIQRGATVSVRGRIVGLSGSLSKYNVSAGVEIGRGWTGEEGKILPNGDFEFDELPPGEHELTVSVRGADGFREIGSTEVNLTDQDITGVVITPFKPARVRVRVVIEGEEDKPLTNGSVSLWPTEDNESTVHNLSAYPPQNATYVFDAVRPGNYHVWFNNASGCYLKSVQSGGRPLDPDSVEVTDGASLDLVMTFSKKVAEISGDVEISGSQPKGSVSVVLIPQNASWALRDMPSPELDQFLHFSAQHVRPGKYFAFATQDDDSDVWDNDQFVRLLRSEGTALEVHEKEHAAIHLKLIPKDVTDRIRQQLGL